MASNHDPERKFLQAFKSLSSGKRRATETWNDFVIMAACAFSNPFDKMHYSEREARYLETVKKYSKDEQQVFPMLLSNTVMALELDPEQDFLGKIFMTLNMGDKRKGQEFTPYSISKLMTEMSITEKELSKISDYGGFFTLNDPCCGAGSTLIAGITRARNILSRKGMNFQNHILVAAQDIDETVALMCYIQLSILGVAAYIKVGDAIANPMSMCDNFEDYWFTPMYFSDIWVMRRALHKMDSLIQSA